MRIKLFVNKKLMAQVGKNIAFLIILGQCETSFIVLFMFIKNYYYESKQVIYCIYICNAQYTDYFYFALKTQQCDL